MSTHTCIAVKIRMFKLISVSVPRFNARCSWNFLVFFLTSVSTTTKRRSFLGQTFLRYSNIEEKGLIKYKTDFYTEILFFTKTVFFRRSSCFFNQHQKLQMCRKNNFCSTSWAFKTNISESLTSSTFSSLKKNK